MGIDLRHIIIIVTGMLIAGCSASSGGDKSTGGTSNSTQSESTYCSGTKNISGASTVVGAQAQFRRFDDSINGLVNTSLHNIRYAEVQILNSQGALVQCGETDGNGGINLAIPMSPGNYQLVVNSRSFNNYVKASILDTPQSSKPYAIVGSFHLNGNETSLQVSSLPVAAHNGTLEGGAFNILEQILSANEFLRTHTSCNFCAAFTVAPKVSVFWKPGLSPGSYFGEPAAATSFFNRQNYSNFGVGIYVLGGIQGSTCTDTDHFDNSVILHEYGHFLEYAFGKSDSPGGMHDGNSTVDPRLAWSEGWADYFQTAALGRTYYRDTVGNSECGNAALAFPDFNIAQPTANQDIPTNDGEGTFREISTSRTLYVATQTYNFPAIWNTFSDPAVGIGNAQLHFRNPSLFLNLLYSNLVSSQRFAQSWSLNSELSIEKQRVDQRRYAVPVHLQSTACASSNLDIFSFAGGSIAQTTMPSANFLNHRYLALDYTGGAGLQVSLKYTSGDSNPYDLDLFAYVENYVFQDSSTVASFSNQDYPETGGSSSWPGIEKIQLSQAGHYMLDVSAFSRVPASATQFYLQTNTGEYICP